MLKRQVVRCVLWWTLAVVVWTWLGLETSVIPATGEICNEAKDAKHQECTTHHIVLVALWHLGKILDNISVVVTAIATAFIAWFTITLAISTKRLWLESRRASRLAIKSTNAAVKSAHVAESSVRPYLYWNVIDHKQIMPSGMVGAAHILYPTANTVHTPTVRISFCNVGRTVALFKAQVFKIGLLTASEFPAQPDYSNPTATGGKTTLDAGKPTNVIPIPMEAINLTSNDWKQVESGEKFFFFWGYATYGDLFGNEHTFRWGLRYFREKGDEGFIEMGGKEYNDQT